MTLEFFHRASTPPARLGILPGTFNPVTVAHLGLAEAALELVDEVVFVLPRVFPHKTYSGAAFEQRVDLLRSAIANQPAFSVAATDHGLFVEIAHACRAAYGGDTRLSFVCGRDAAERIIEWDYGDLKVVPDMLGEFDLLVADRGGTYWPPNEFSHAICRLPLENTFDPISATEVRERIARAEPWEHLVPAAIREQVREIYRATGPAPDSPPEK